MDRSGEILFEVDFHLEPVPVNPDIVMSGSCLVCFSEEREITFVLYCSFYNNDY